MYTITINHKDIGKKIYEIYTKEEADKENITYSPWKKAKEGEWALSDDGFVSKVIKKRRYGSNHEIDNVYLRFAWGYTFYNPKYSSKELKVKGRKSNTTLTGKRPIEVKARQEKMKNLAMVYAQTMNTEKTIAKVYGEIDPNTTRRVKRNMRTEVFKGMVREELSKLLADHDMTEDYTLDLLESTIKKAQDKGDVTNLMRAIENLQDMHGMKDKSKLKTTTQIEGTVTRKLLDKIQEEEKKLIATETVEQDIE